MGRNAHHRNDKRNGLAASSALHLAAPGWVLERLVAGAVRIGPDLYRIRGGAALMLKARVVLEDWRRVSSDMDGGLFE
jgi:hypothetical protein